MNLFDLYAKISLDSSEYESGIKEASASGESFASKLKSGLSTAGSVAAKGLGVVTGAATAVGGALLALEANTEEYRVAQGRLNTAFEAAGYSTETAKEAYTGFYQILGDTDTATEASQLLAKLADSAEDVSTWTNIAAGVNGTFGDSLPIEGLIEASNETAKVGTVTGVLADALNWAGISEDDFNEKLAAASSETERNQLIMETLSSTYSDAADAFYENNDALIQARDNQISLQDSMAKVGEAVSTVKNAFLEQFTPAISQASTMLAGFISGLDVSQIMSSVQGLVSAFTSLLPAITGVTAAVLAYKAAMAISTVITSVTTALKAAQAAAQGMGVAQAALNAVMNANPFVLIATLIAGVVTALMTLWATNEDFRNAVTEIWEGIKSAFVTAWEAIKATWDAVPGFFSNIWSNIQTAFSAVDSWLSEKFGLAWQGIKTYWDAVGGYFQQVWETIKGIFAVVADVLTGDFQGAWDGIKGIVSGWADYFRGVWDNIKGLFSDAGSYFLNIGKNIVQGVWNGISGMIGWFTGKVTSFFSGIVNSAKNALDIHSPSRVFADIGKNMALGVGVGWDGEYDGIKKDIDDGLNFSGSATLSASGSGYGSGTAAGSIGTVNITVNGAKYSNDRQLAKAIAEELQNMTNRKAAVYA